MIESPLSDSERNLREIIIDQVDKIVKQELLKDKLLVFNNGDIKPSTMGVCHIYWEKMKGLLKEEYNITWASPRDENPFTMYN